MLRFDVEEQVGLILRINIIVSLNARRDPLVL